MLFANLGKVYDKYNFQCQDTYNMDKTAVITVQKQTRIIERKGVNQVGAETSAERGSPVTMAVAVSAIWNSIPPLFIFPRKNYRDYFIANGPEDSAGSANKSVWMTGDDFLLFMEHFIKNTGVTNDRLVLLLLDNHQSHLAVKVLDLGKENGLVLLFSPPYTSHKLQYFDRSVYGAFKTFVKSASDAWLGSNPEINMTVYDIPSTVSQSLPNALTPKNI
jgi:hypothetical protein